MSAPAIVARRLVKRFGSFVAVDDVSFEVERGEIFGYLGANGAGKSTTIRILCGLLEPTSGDATVAGASVSEDPEAVKAALGYMSQKFSLYLDLSVADNLAFFGGAYGLSGKELRARSGEVLELTGLTEHRTDMTGALPGGTRQRVALACAILHRPQVLFLDEPTAGVDPTARRLFWRLIRELSRGGTTVFVTTHYLDEAEYCGRIGLMVDGRLVALDTPAGLKRTHVPERIFAVRGAPAAPATTVLRDLKGIRAVEPFGAGLHVRAEPGSQDVEDLSAALRAAGLWAEIEPVEPSLEDVFLAVVGEAARRKEAKP
jgi:ABC-2 type transport system ATP-binding protein